MVSENVLENQNIKNNSQLLVIHLSQSEIEARQKQQLEQEMASQVSRTRHAAEVLSKRMDGLCYLSLIDQNCLLTL